MSHRIVYLTGAPAVGKSTTATTLCGLIGAELFSYGAVLTERLRARVSDQAELRALSSQVISAADVAAADALLLEATTRTRDNAGSMIVDSHAVTKEPYGFRCVPYDHATLAAVGYTQLVCLYVDPDVMAARIRADASGRPLPSVKDLEAHTEMQRSLTLTYAHSLGCPAYFVRADGTPEDVVQQVRGLLQL